MPSTAPLKRGPAPSHDSPRSLTSFPPALCLAWMPGTSYVNIDGSWQVLLGRRGTADIRLVVFASAPRYVYDLLPGRRGKQVPVSDQLSQRRVRAAIVRPPAPVFDASVLRRNRLAARQSRVQFPPPLHAGSAGQHSWQYSTGGRPNADDSLQFSVACFGLIDRSIGEPPCALRCRRTDARNAAVVPCPAGRLHWTGTPAQHLGRLVTCHLWGIRRDRPQSLSQIAAPSLEEIAS
jgi:hypothetical protein